MDKDALIEATKKIKYEQVKANVLEWLKPRIKTIEELRDIYMGVLNESSVDFTEGSFNLFYAEYCYDYFDTIENVFKALDRCRLKV